MKLSRRKFLGGVAAAAIAAPAAAQPLVYGRAFGHVGLIEGMQVYDPRGVELVGTIIDAICQQWGVVMDDILINGNDAPPGILGDDAHFKAQHFNEWQS